MRILSYPVSSGEFSLTLPADYRIVYIGKRNNTSKIWVETKQNLDIAYPLVTEVFKLVRTGEEYEGEYVGTFSDTWYLYHLIKI